MVGLTEIKTVQGQGDWAKHDIQKADDLILDVIQFACCNKLMRMLRFLFGKRFDKQYDKLLRAKVWLGSAEESLEEQWELLEDYWHDEAMTNELEET